MLGPLLSGILSEAVGYFNMSLTLGKSLEMETLLLCFSDHPSASICLANAVFVWSFFEKGIAKSKN
jgi:hypothetical protein